MLDVFTSGSSLAINVTDFYFAASVYDAGIWASNGVLPWSPASSFL